MIKKLEIWCYGGESKAFFIKHIEVIHQYNSKMMDRLLIIMTIIIGCYLVIGSRTELFAKYYYAYLVCFIALIILFCTFKLKKNKSITFTRIYILIFACVVFAFVSLLGTMFEPNSRATLFIVYVLALPMLFIVPTHYMYGYLTVVTCIFSAMALNIKMLNYAEMDIAHAVTCLVIGMFLSHHILESRISLYQANERLDTHNLKLDRQLQEQAQQMLQSRIAILLSQIQPHFLYNTLSVICGLCDENPKEAQKVTAEFADYLRHNLDTLSQRTLVSFENELKHTRVYLNIEKKRFENNLHVAYDIEVEDFRIPSLTVQPLVENAVKHGVLKRKNGGVVSIVTRELENFYQIIVVDDGVGFDSADFLEEPGMHTGIKNVRSRLRAMCKGTLEIESEVGKGTKAVILIPKKDDGTA